MSLTSSIQEMNQYCFELTEYMQLLKGNSNPDKVRELSELRGISLEVLQEADVFYIDNMSEMLIPKYLRRLTDFGVISQTNLKPIFRKRWVFPIKDEFGRVINFVGYSNMEKERYIYGTATYYSRQDDLYGLENLHSAYKDGYAIITEGITDILSIRSIDKIKYKNSFAYCGTMASEIKLGIMSRFRYGTINIHDRDKAGDKSRDNWDTYRHVTFLTPLQFKDSNETLNADEGKYRVWYENCLDASIEWLKQEEHKGIKSLSVEATML